MPTITVHIMPDKAETLTRIAFAERRHPREQAAWFIERALEAATSSGAERAAPDGTQPASRGN
jgi:hypothetical protein